MAISIDKRLVSFNANTEAYEQFKAKAKANGTDATTLLNQAIQSYIDDAEDNSNSQPAQDSQVAAVIEKLRARLEAVATKLDESAEQVGSNLPDLLAIRDGVIRDWENDPEKQPKRIRITQFGPVIDLFIERVEAAIGAGRGSHIQRLKAEVERVTALYEAEQESSAQLARRYKAAKGRLKVLGEDAW